MKKLLVDGDILVYWFSFANECVIVWDGPVQSRMVTPERALLEVDNFIEKLLNKTDCSE